MVVKGRKQRSVPPSRARYEKSHPTVTIRVDLELYNELKALKETAGMSLADILKVGLEKSQAAAGDALEKGFKEGYETAEAEYKVTYRCGRCRPPHLSITSDEEKKVAATFLYEAGWGDLSCHQR